jgi:hypothetical protein
LLAPVIPAANAKRKLPPEKGKPANYRDEVERAAYKSQIIRFESI